MVQLATQLIDRQTGRYDPADVEDRYETRLRALIDAKLKGKGLEPEEEEQPDRSNVVDLMSALRKSLGQSAEEPAKKKSSAPARSKAKPAAKAKAAATGTAKSSAKPAARRRA